MGEWSDYFEDFPEEDPENWINGRFDPELRARQNQTEIIKAEAQAKANAELYRKIKEVKARSLLDTKDCPQCGLKKLNTYNISDWFYLCECQDCGIYGTGTSHEKALEKTKDALGEGLDWRNNPLL